MFKQVFLFLLLLIFPFSIFFATVTYDNNTFNGNLFWYYCVDRLPATSLPLDADGILAYQDSCPNESG